MIKIGKNVLLSEHEPRSLTILSSFIDWTEFIASVIELTDNEGETKSSDVNLSLLFPISLPEDKVNSEALDHFRFFLNNLWFPWDEENDDERDSLNRWFQEHFQNRVILNL